MNQSEQLLEFIVQSNFQFMNFFLIEFSQVKSISIIFNFINNFFTSIINVYGNFSESVFLRQNIKAEFC
jgi:hypothetical protein